VLKLRQPKNDKKVKWTNETVDNEHLNKKKSKCKYLVTRLIWKACGNCVEEHV